MEMLSQIQVRMSEAFSFISFFFSLSLRSLDGRVGGELKKKKSAEIRRRGQMREREKEVQ